MKSFFTTILLLLTIQHVVAQRGTIDTSLINNKQRFDIRTRDIDGNSTVLSAQCKLGISVIDTLDKAGLGKIHSIDFDNDGNVDILVTYRGNNDYQVLYLFDTTTNRFKKVEGFDDYPAAQPIRTNAKYYYSYHRGGCSDMDWVSDLFKITNFKTIKLGSIYGRGCDFDIKEYPQEITIFKAVNNQAEKDKLIAKLPYKKFIEVFEGKWDFIEEYWNKHYKNFD